MYFTYGTTSLSNVNLYYTTKFSCHACKRRMYAFGFIVQGCCNVLLCTYFFVFPCANRYKRYFTIFSLVEIPLDVENWNFGYRNNIIFTKSHRSWKVRPYALTTNTLYSGDAYTNSYFTWQVTNSRIYFCSSIWKCVVKVFWMSVISHSNCCRVFHGS